MINGSNSNAIKNTTVFQPHTFMSGGVPVVALCIVALVVLVTMTLSINIKNIAPIEANAV